MGRRRDYFPRLIDDDYRALKALDKADSHLGALSQNPLLTKELRERLIKMLVALGKIRKEFVEMGTSEIVPIINKITEARKRARGNYESKD